MAEASALTVLAPATFVAVRGAVAIAVVVTVADVVIAVAISVVIAVTIAVAVISVAIAVVAVDFCPSLPVATTTSSHRSKQARSSRRIFRSSQARPASTRHIACATISRALIILSQQQPLLLLQQQRQWRQR